MYAAAASAYRPANLWALPIRVSVAARPSGSAPNVSAADAANASAASGSPFWLAVTAAPCKAHARACSVGAAAAAPASIRRPSANRPRAT